MKKNLLNIITTNSVNDDERNEWHWVEDEDEKEFLINQNKKDLDLWHRDPGSRSTRWSEYTYYPYSNLSDIRLEEIQIFSMGDFVKLMDLVKQGQRTIEKMEEIDKILYK